MERLKNVYKISADLEDGTTITKHIFSHTHDNALNSVELILKDVIY